MAVRSICYNQPMKLLWLILLILTHLSACTAVSTPATPTPTPLLLSSYLAQAQPLLAERRYTAAVAILEEAAQAFPADPLPLVKMGQIYLAQSRWLLAEDAFNRALARAPTHPAALAGLAQTLAHQGRTGEAYKFWQEAARADPKLPSVFTGLGRTRLTRLDFSGAEAAFLEQHRQNPDPEALWRLAALVVSKDWAKAMAYLAEDSQNPQSDDPKSEQAQGWRGYLTETLASFNADSPPAEVAKAVGIALAQVGEWPLAIHALTLAGQTGPADAETLSFLGHALAQAGQPAVEVFEQAHQADPTSALPLYFRGMYLRQQGALRAAEQFLTQAIKLDPENAALYVELAQIKTGQGNLADAEALYQAAVEVSQQDPAFQRLLVYFYADRGYRLAEAGVPAAQALVEADAANAEAHDLMGWMQFLAGAPDGGEPALRRAVELDPNLVSARYHLARWLAVNGQSAQAAAEYQRVIDWDTTGIFRDRALKELQN
jgi:tetratricopeptide (TPR) repeat protein